MLIVFEGVDSSGKATQSNLFYKYLKKKGTDVMKISFPDYDSPSSSLVKMYLGGEFGSSAQDVSPYAASALYAVDRFASYKTKWEKFLMGGGVVVADRYVTSNMVHQASKLKTNKEKDDFLAWLDDFEYVKLGLPRPDKVIFLDMPPDFASMLMEDRKNKITGQVEKDIHERDSAYLYSAYNNACYIADKLLWTKVRCAFDSVRPIDDIEEEIRKTVGI